MGHGNAVRPRVVAVGAGAVLTCALVPGTAHADPDHSDWMRPAPIPPVAAVASEPLARGAAGEFAIQDRETGVRVAATEPTDVVLVRATLPPESSTGWHRHAGPSVVVVNSGTLRMVAPQHGDGHGCSEETFASGTAFAHPSSTHTFANDGPEPLVFSIVYFVPEGASPAPIPADPPHGC
ncbi:cupin domain-containing protein [Geodermatophilus marinus]|uniref:hypothetical protein n=1 Tax=Geodermatophilus sp. LHW52908 TaxID=2303986 RepID=UPI000E3CC382|nr:hypothetical protein [Geodermatophilus sp. LHW52908]RFU19235.1 hypothetical protein D0Z06_22340 [Geodermatophilus sp. LHW52908]